MDSITILLSHFTENENITCNFMLGLRLTGASGLILFCQLRQLLRFVGKITFIGFFLAGEIQTYSEISLQELVVLPPLYV